MENGILLTVSLVAALGGSIFKKLYTNRDSRLSGSFAYTAVGCLVAAAVLFAWGGFGKASLFTVLLGVLFGAVTALQGVTNMAALQVGPLSYTTVIISFSTLISALSDVLFFGESIGLWQIIGMVLMLVSGVCVAANNKLNLYLSGVIDSVIFFPVVNGGGLVLTTLASLIIFKERLRTKQWIGILLGIASVLCLCIG